MKSTLLSLTKQSPCAAADEMTYYLQPFLYMGATLRIRGGSRLLSVGQSCTEQVSKRHVPFMDWQFSPSSMLDLTTCNAHSCAGKQSLSFIFVLQIAIHHCFNFCTIAEYTGADLLLSLLCLKELLFALLLHLLFCGLEVGIVKFAKISPLDVHLGACGNDIGLVHSLQRHLQEEAWPA